MCSPADGLSKIGDDLSGRPDAVPGCGVDGLCGSDHGVPGGNHKLPGGLDHLPNGCHVLPARADNLPADVDHLHECTDILPCGWDDLRNQAQARLDFQRRVWAVA